MILLAPTTLASGEAAVYDVSAGIRLGIIPGSGATVTYSKVDSKDAAAHDTDTSATTTAELALDVEWPYYRVSTAGGACRVALI